MDPEIENFTGTVIQRDRDGSGLVKFMKPGVAEPQIGFFNHEVTYHPAVDRICKVGNTVIGSAEKFGQSYHVLRIEP